MTKHVHVSCPKCGYEEHLMRGSASPAEALSDPNEEYACMEVFKCKKCKKFMSLSMSEKYCVPKGQKLNHSEMCATCGTKLVHVNHTPDKCPKCRTKLKVETH